MDDLNGLARSYRDSVQFVFVYILEAHAADEWPIAGVNDSVRQHVSLEDRTLAAQQLLDVCAFDENIRLMLDNMSNAFNATYSSWPTRYWIVDAEGRIAVKMMPDPVDNTISLHRLCSWLSQHVGNKVNKVAHAVST